MSPELLLVCYLMLIVGGSLLGGMLPSLVRLTHLRMQIALSLVGGLMLGVGLLHLLPHAVAESGSLDRTMQWVLAGLLTTFFLIRAFHFHEHAPVEPLAARGEMAGASHVPPRAGHSHHPPGSGAGRVRWLTVSFGLGVHTLIDGITLGAAVAVEASLGDRGLLATGVFIAILLHKPLDALSITTLMQSAGWSLGGRQVANVAVALMCPVGAWLAWEIGRQPAHSPLLGAVLGFAAGAFVCISLSDLLPELQFHHHDGVILSLALVGGILLALVIGWMEPAGVHEAGWLQGGSRSGRGMWPHSVSGGDVSVRLFAPARRRLPPRKCIAGSVSAERPATRGAAAVRLALPGPPFYTTSVCQQTPVPSGHRSSARPGEFWDGWQCSTGSREAGGKDSPDAARPIWLPAMSRHRGLFWCGQT